MFINTNDEPYPTAFRIKATSKGKIDKRQLKTFVIMASCNMFSEGFRKWKKIINILNSFVKLLLHCDNGSDDAIMLIIGAYLIMTSFAGHKVTIKSTKIWGVVLQHSHATTFTSNIKCQNQKVLFSWKNCQKFYIYICAAQITSLMKLDMVSCIKQTKQSI